MPPAPQALQQPGRPSPHGRCASLRELTDEGRTAPVDGWDFSWFDGRASEARPPWGYQRLLAERLPHVADVLDLQTGGGEVTAGALHLSEARPNSLTATESWPPNLALARAALAPWDGRVLECANDEVPCSDESVDLAVSRHPVTTPWDHLARVLRPGGTFLSQQIGPGTVRELTEAMIGPIKITGRFSADAQDRARAAGLDVVRLETASLPMTFDDIGAVVAFLRKVIWIVPNFTVDAYLPQLRTLHERIRAEGPFHATSKRFLIKCRKPQL